MGIVVKRRYQVVVEWTMQGTVFIEATGVDEAAQLATQEQFDDRYFEDQVSDYVVVEVREDDEDDD